MKHKLVGAYSEKGIARLAFYKRSAIDKWISSRGKKQHGESADVKMNAFD